jgi:hypothetical protein
VPTNGKALLYRDERIIGNRDRVFSAAGILMKQKKKIVNRIMDDTKNIDAQIDDDLHAGLTPRREELPKSRQCLKCREPFSSEWSGERVCKRCKSSGTWRSGL